MYRGTAWATGWDVNRNARARTEAKGKDKGPKEEDILTSMHLFSFDIGAQVPCW